MIGKVEAVQRAISYLKQQGYEDIGNCTTILEFSDGTMTLHFVKPRVEVVDSNTLRIQTSELIIATVDGQTGQVTIPEQL